MTVDRLREQLKARKLPTTGNKKLLATRLSAHLDQQVPRQQSARQREPPRQRGATDRSTKARRPRSTAARQRELSEEPAHRRGQRRKSRSRSRSPLSTRSRRSQRGDERRGTTVGRQRDLPRSSRSERRARERTPRASSPSDSSESSDNDSATEEEQTRPSSSEGDATAASRRTRRAHRQRTLRRASPKRRRHKPRWKRRRLYSSSSSSSSGTSTDTTYSSSSVSSSDSESSRNHRSKQTRSRKHTSRLSSRAKSKLKRLSVPCCPPLPTKYAARIVRGEYVSFDKLTISKRPRDGNKSSSKQTRRTVTGLSTWLEAWNRFAGVVIATKPRRALQLIKYQTLIVAAFQDYPAEACIEYDRRFRQLAAKDKSVPWDKYKEDVFVWCFSPKSSSSDLRQSFRFNKPTIMSRLGPPADTITHAGAEICIRFNTPRGCTKGEACKFKHICNKRGCGGDHSASKCPSKQPPT